MKQFKFKAKKSATEVVQDSVQAESREEAISKINDMGLMPVDVVEEKVGKVSPEGPKDLSKIKLPVKEVTSFYRQLGRLVKAGVPILRALSIMIEQTETPNLKAIVQKIQADVREGTELSGALRAFPKLFTNFDISMVQAGESVGKLSDTLLQVAKYREDQAVIRSKVKGALAYPFFVMLVGLGTVIFMLSHVIPQFSGFFLDLGQELPVPTKLLIATSEWSRSHIWWVLILVVALVFLFKKSLASKPNRLAWHRFCLSLPRIGSFMAMSQIARMSRTMELLLQNGLSLLKAIKTCVPVLDNEVFKAELEKSHKLVEEGGSFSEGLKQSKLFPLVAIYLIRTGEESGNLHEAMSEIANWYEREVNDTIQVLTKLIEPVLILVLGLFLGGIVGALLLPVFNMSAVVS